MDVTDTAFALGGRAWQLCCDERADLACLGLGLDVPEVSGWWYVRGRLLLDPAALYQQELLCWDEWSYATEDYSITPEDEALLNQAAALSLQPDLTALTELWQSEPRLHVPEIVLCFSPAIGSHVVELATAPM
jgi:hypothetical protein